MSEDVELIEPVPGTPIDDPIWERYWRSIADRTGGQTDLVSATNTMAGDAQSSADGAQSSANTAQVTAVGAQASSDSNLVEINRLRFIGGLL